MLTSMKEMLGCRLQATDDELGRVKDFYFDDRDWKVRYLLADTHRWLPGRRVLISPESLGRPDPSEHVVAVSLTKEQVKNSPEVGRGKAPLVSRKEEMTLSEYYRWPVYWAPVSVPAAGMMPGRIAPQPAGPPDNPAGVPEAANGEPDLRSVDDVTGYDVQATNGEIGHVEDFLFDPDEWAIRYVAVDTRDWLPGRKVLIGLNWIQQIRWDDEVVHVNHTRQQIKDSPRYDPSEPIDREYEEELHEHYDAPRYWRGRTDESQP